MMLPSRWEHEFTSKKCRGRDSDWEFKSHIIIPASGLLVNSSMPNRIGAVDYWR